MILGILQARLSSSRLPGKVLLPVLGRPMIHRQLERITRSRLLDHVVVATSTDVSDDRLASVLSHSAIDVRRGPLDDVVSRFESVVEEFAPSTIVRLTADCPLADPMVIDAVIAQHLESNSDYTSNTLDPTYPDGLDVECIKQEAFERLVRLPLTAQEREHVTLGIYARPGEFTLSSVTQSENHSDLRWTVDVEDDLRFVHKIYELLYGADREFDQSAVLRVLAANPDMNRTNQDVARNAGLSREEER